MRNFLLTKIRLSVYFWIFFVVSLVLSITLPGYTFTAGALTLFSVNSFLYGFYISPILGAQKSRIEEMHKIVRTEANALFSLVLQLKKLPDALHDKLQTMIEDYVRAKVHQHGLNSGEKEYEALITYCVDYKGDHKEQIDKTLEALVTNQQNRTNLSMQMNSKVFTNEWHITAILFSITLGFILSLDIGKSLIFHVVRALLCTALTMLVLILVKLSTLTHKKAKQMWEPLKKLVDTNFYRTD
ncbi:MAG: hypothetical protein WA843_04035 [Candidatus Saccharimonadales bacterium]